MVASPAPKTAALKGGRGFPRPFGRYILDDRIAMGGMAEIFRAHTGTEGFEKQVCIKRVLPHFLESEEFITMFRDEAGLAAKLQHANVVQVFDFGQVDGALFLAMEYVNGIDLRSVLRRGALRKERLWIAYAVQIAVEVCKGLHHAHTLWSDGRPLDLVHRDVSPHNILISAAGEVKVADFGIAKAAERATHTASGVIKGKLSYMSPEQAAGSPIDHRSDQFSTGIVLWEMLTGTRLFEVSEATVLQRVLTCDFAAPSSQRSEIPPELEAIVLRALSPKVDARFPDMRALERALTRFFYGFVNDPGAFELERLMTRILSEGPKKKETQVLPIAAESLNVDSMTEADGVFTNTHRPQKAPRADPSLDAKTAMLDGATHSNPPVAQLNRGPQEQETRTFLSASQPFSVANAELQKPREEGDGLDENDLAAVEEITSPTTTSVTFVPPTAAEEKPTQRAASSKAPLWIAAILVGLLVLGAVGALSWGS